MIPQGDILFKKICITKCYVLPVLAKNNCTYFAYMNVMMLNKNTLKYPNTKIFVTWKQIKYTVGQNVS